MKDEAKFAAPISPDRERLSSHQKSDCRDYEPELTIKATHAQDLGTAVEFPPQDIELGIPKRFEKIVAQYPDRLAVKTTNCSLTYCELNAMANRVASVLLQDDLSETQPVALLFDKGPDLIAAMLGVLKAGRFFVLLDSSNPKQRLGSLFGDSQASLLLTDGRNSCLGREILSNHQKFFEFASIDQTTAAENHSLDIAPDALAFITYTSGSTGRPKAVMQNHRNVLYDTAWLTRSFSFTEHDRFGHLTAGTSSAVKLALHPLMNGTAVLLYDVKAQGVNNLSNWFEAERISICFIGAPLFRKFCETLTGRDEFPDLRLVRVASEAIYQSDLENFKMKFPPNCNLVGGLGSTETGGVSLFFMNHQTVLSGNDIPVGYPPEKKKVLLLDDDRREVPVGEVGEIVVKSKYLSPGYWRCPELTEAKFKTDPEDGTERLYYTGDLGLMLSDGCLIHKGRKDFRIKIRGYGVDLAEVERILLEHPAIQNAIVLPAKNESGENYLIAYFISNIKSPSNVSELRRYLLTRLPEHSVPSVFNQLDTFPLTSNGKVDRSALPMADRRRPHLNVPYVEPRSPAEKTLARIWTEVLDIEPIGVRDDFFDLGGHSLLAASLFARIEKTFGKTLSPQTLHFARTIEQLVDLIRQGNLPAISSLLIPLQPKGSKPPFFWAGGYESDIYLPRLLGPDQPIYGLLNQCHDGHRPMYGRLEDLAAHHIEEIRAVQPHGPYFLGGPCFGGMVAFEMAQQLKRQGQQVALLFLLDLCTVVNIQNFPDGSTYFREKPQSRESARKRINRHIGELTKLKLVDKLEYVRVRMANRASMIRSFFIYEIICRMRLATGRAVLPSLQGRYILEVDRRVMRKYKPQFYSGRMVHVRAEAGPCKPDLVQKLTKGRLEEHVLPCIHRELLNEPHISIWAKWLKSDLSDTQMVNLRRTPLLESKQDRVTSHF